MGEYLNKVVLHFDFITKLLLELVDSYLRYIGPDAQYVRKMLNLDFVHGERSDVVLQNRNKAYQQQSTPICVRLAKC